jgi:hypothetical protein
VKGRLDKPRLEGGVRFGDDPEIARRAFDKLAYGAMKRTLKGVVEEHTKNAASRAVNGTPAPVTPDEGAIRSAADQEKQVILAILESRRAR